MSDLWLERFCTLGRELGQGLLQLLYPNLCALCGCPLPPSQGAFCCTCQRDLTSDPQPSCPRCAATVGPFVHLEGGCASCRDERLHFEQVLRLGPYTGRLREAILRMKHARDDGLAELLGELWAVHAEARLRAAGTTVVVPVPLHWWRRWERGFNQSEALARGLAQRLGLPCRPDWLQRRRYTPAQTGQSGEARRQNVRGAFQARPRAELRDQAVLLVDDVVTTMSTADDAARALRAAGASRVVVAALARTSR